MASSARGSKAGTAARKPEATTTQHAMQAHFRLMGEILTSIS
jgi:hypothetical protein